MAPSARSPTIAPRIAGSCHQGAIFGGATAGMRPDGNDRGDDTGASEMCPDEPSAMWPDDGGGVHAGIGAGVRTRCESGGRGMGMRCDDESADAIAMRCDEGSPELGAGAGGVPESHVGATERLRRGTKRTSAFASSPTFWNLARRSFSRQRNTIASRSG